MLCLFFPAFSLITAIRLESALYFFDINVKIKIFYLTLDDFTDDLYINTVSTHNSRVLTARIKRRHYYEMGIN